MAESLFTSQTPTLTNGQDGAPGITVATTLRFAAAGTITHIRWYVGAFNGGGTWTGGIWEVGSTDAGGGGVAAPGSPLVNKVGTVTTEGGWNAVALDTPIAVTTDKLFRVGMHNDSRYVASNGFFSAGLTNGNITAPADGSDPLGNGWAVAQGTFKISSDATAYPNQTFGSTCYFVDVVFEPSSSSVVEAAAALSVTATLTAGAVRTALPGAALSATATLAAGASRTALPAAALPVTATLAAGTSRQALPVAALSATATLTAGATVGAAPITAAAALSVTATLNAGATRTAPATAALNVTASLGAAAGRAAAPAAALAATATLTAGAGSLRSAGAALAAVATLTAMAASTPAGGSSAPGPVIRTTARPRVLSTSSRDLTLRTTN